MQRSHARIVLPLAFATLALLASSCASTPVAKAGWSSSWLLSSILRLVSDTRVEELRFGSEQYVSATVGARGGPLSGPLLPWHIANGKLGIGNADSYELLEFVSSSGTVITARRRNGTIEKYELTERKRSGAKRASQLKERRGT